MKSLIFKVALLGLFFGFLGAASTMLLGLIIYYGITVIDIYLTSSFLKYAALISLAIGLCCMLAWYLYIALLAKNFIVHIFSKR